MPATANPQHTPAYKIFHYPFRIWIPQLYLSGIAENEAIGTYTSGNAKVDREASRQQVAITSTIANMIDFYRRGIRIEFNGPADCVRIYETICEHISSFNEHISRAMFKPSDIPWDDLKTLDEFAGEVYLKARGAIANREQSSYALHQLESECAAIVRLGPTEAESIFDDVASSNHKQTVAELENSFQRRYKPWQ